MKNPTTGSWRKISGLLVCTFAFCLTIIAQDLIRNQITTKNGLNSNAINALFEDREGFIWIATERGVLRYDGYHFEDIGSNWDYLGQPVTYAIKHITQHPLGTIMAATERGLLLVDPGRKQYHHVPMPPLTYLFIDSREDIYCLDNGQQLLKLMMMDNDPLLWEIDDHFPLGQFEVSMHFGRAAIAEFDHKIWFGGKTEGLCRYDPQSNTVEQGFLSGTITSLLVDHKNQLWAGTYSGLFKYQDGNNRFNLHSGDPDTTDEASSEKVMDIYEDHRNRLWISRENQLAIYDPVMHQWQRKWFFANNVNPADPINPSMASALANQPNYNLVLPNSSEGKIWTFSTLDNRMHWEDHVKTELSGLGYLSSGVYTPKGRIIIKTGLVDRSGKVWVGTRSDGIFTFNAHILPYTQIRSSADLAARDREINISNVIEDHLGNLWIGKWTDKIYLLKDQLAIPISLHTVARDPLIKTNVIRSDSEGNIWIGTTNGLFQMDLEAGAIHLNYALNAKVEASSVEYSKHLTHYAVDGNHRTRWASLMYAPQEFTIDLEDERFISLLVIFWNTLPQNYVVHISTDQSHWQQIEHRQGNVGKIDQIAIDQHCRYIRIRALERGSIFTISIAEVYALGKRPEIRKIRPVKSNYSEDLYINDILTSTDKTWVLTSDGLGKVDKNNSQLEIWKIKDTTNYCTENDLVQAKLDDSGMIWIVDRSRSQIVFFNSAMESFHKGFNLADFAGEGFVINKLTENRAGEIQILTNHGLWHRSPENHTLQLISPDLDILDAYWGEDHTIWLGTNGQGLYVSDGTGFKRMENVNLPNQVASIFSDQNDHLWIGSVSGLYCIDILDEKVYRFSNQQAHPIPDLSRPAFQDRTGKIYYIDDGNLVRLNPDLFYINNNPPSLAITDIRVNESMWPISESLHLSPKENNLQIHFSAMHHDRSEQNRYSYRLLPVQTGWVNLGTQQQINFSGLRPGKYELLLKSCNADHICMDSPYVLAFRIKPPWYLRWWALGCWAVGLAILVRIYLSFQRKSLLVNQELLYEKKEAQRLRELDKTKSRFFTNVSHEFRTPLTIIGGMARQIADSLPQKEIILRNTERLQRQINHILDLGKLESGQFRHAAKRGNIINEIRNILQAFDGLILDKQITLSTDLQPDRLVFEYDPRMLEGIVYNLISNAVKFTPTKGQIDVSTNIDRINNQFIFSVTDSGPGIPEALHDKIFDRFYQINDSSSRLADGSGIGLAIVKEFTDKLGGQINVSTETSAGARFVVTIPLHCWEEDISEEKLKINSQVDHRESLLIGHGQSAKDLALILIVEDNYEMARYLQSLLTNTYNLKWARNGQEGLEQAIKYVPDIIISDIMMPQMDGLDLLEKLRDQVSCSHIPVILLTAKATDEEKRKGMDKGALVYLTKPFDEQILSATIENTLHLRNQFIERLKTAEAIDQLNIPEKRELVFLRQINQILIERLDEEQFGTDALARSLSMSVSQLYRKLKAITGQSIAEYIKEFRLSQAKKLLENSDLTVGEISGRVGFTSLAYFSRIFKDRYAQSPSNIRQKANMD